MEFSVKKRKVEDGAVVGFVNIVQESWDKRQEKMCKYGDGKFQQVLLIPVVIFDGLAYYDNDSKVHIKFL
uniref:Single-stranded DNA-binding protein n=1 Tax=Syphacia muris TaxID=451379 RepID=A0A0N5AJF4_9BILA